MESSELNRISEAIRESMGGLVGEFKQAAEKNNANITRVIKDIARVFSEQKSELSQLLNASEQNITETEKLNSEIQNLASAFQESITIQTSIHGALKNVAEGISGLSHATEALNDSIAGGGNSVTGLLGGILRAFDFIPGAFKAAVAGIGFGAAAGSAYNLMGGGGGGDAQLAGAGGSYNAEKAAALIRKVGGTEQEATILGAISQPESAGNPSAHNPNRATGDNSYGLWQINMLDKLGPERRAKYGITNNEQLKDPETNARIALQMLREAHGVPRDWTTWKNNKHLPYMEAARRGASGNFSQDAATTPHSDATPTTGVGATPNLTPQSTPMQSMTSPGANGGGIISSTAGASDAKQFLQSREVGRGENTGVQAEKLNPDFASKLMAAIQAAERATNSKVGITEGYRDPRVQAQYYSDYVGKPITFEGKTYQPNPAKFGRLAAPPGRSNHQKGMAADLTESPAREWIRVHASEFGLRQLGNRDMPHFELAGASSMSDGSTSQASYNVGGTGATPAGGGSPITPGMSGDTPSISQQAMAANQPPPMSPEVQQMVNNSTNNLIGGGGMGMGGMMGMAGGIASMLPPLAASISSASLQETPNNTGVMLNNNEQEAITSQLKEAAVSKQAQAEISQEQTAETAKQQAVGTESISAGAMYNSDPSFGYNQPHDTGVPEWASKFFLGWHETNKFKTWG